MRAAEGLLVNGQRHGSWTSWHQDGSIKQISVYRDGIPHGRWIAYWENQQKLWEGTYEDGLSTGFWCNWHENGEMSHCGVYKVGLKNGFWRAWDDEGIMLSEGHYITGLRKGGWRFRASKAGTAYFTEWYKDELTNVPGRPPRQVQYHHGIYYPIVPGQIAGQVTPFSRRGASTGVYFAYQTHPSGIASASGPYSYLFQPAATLDRSEPGGMDLALRAENSGTAILELLYTCSPGETLTDTQAREQADTQFVVLGDPLIAGIRPRQYRRFTTSLEDAMADAQSQADQSNSRTLVAVHRYQYPPDRNRT